MDGLLIPPHDGDPGRGDGSPRVAFLWLSFAPAVAVVNEQHAPGLLCFCVATSFCSLLSKSRYERTEQKEIAGASRCAVALLPLRPWRRSCHLHRVWFVCMSTSLHARTLNATVILTKCAVACVLCALFSCVLVVSCRGAEEEMPTRSGEKEIGQHKTIWQQKQPETRCCGAAASTARCGRANELRQLNPIKRA